MEVGLAVAGFKFTTAHHLSKFGIAVPGKRKGGDEVEHVRATAVLDEAAPAFRDEIAPPAAAMRRPFRFGRSVINQPTPRHPCQADGQFEGHEVVVEAGFVAFIEEEALGACGIPVWQRCAGVHEATKPNRSLRRKIQTIRVRSMSRERMRILRELRTDVRQSSAYSVGKWRMIINARRFPAANGESSSTECIFSRSQPAGFGNAILGAEASLRGEAGLSDGGVRGPAWRWKRGGSDWKRSVSRQWRGDAV